MADVKERAVLAVQCSTADLSSLGRLLQEIDRIAAEPQDEHTPTASAVERAKALISGAQALVNVGPPAGELDSYYGELGIEWRSGNRILRLTCFGNPATPARLDYGTMSTGTPGEYQSDAVADSVTLAARLDWLSTICEPLPPADSCDAQTAPFIGEGHR